MWTGYLYSVASGVGAALLLFGLSMVLRRLSGFALPSRGNHATHFLDAGRLIGVFLVISSVISGARSGELAADLLWLGVFGVTGLLLLELSSAAGVRLLVGAKLAEEIKGGNMAAGLAAGGHYASTGVIIASCLYGDNLSTLQISLIFCLLGQLSLHLLVLFFRALTAYQDDEEIMGQNAAVALSYAGVMVALSIVIGNATDGSFEGFLPALSGYGLALACGLLFYPLRQFLLQGVLLRLGFSLRGGGLDQHIAAKRDLGMAAMEAATYIGTAFLVRALA